MHRFNLTLPVGGAKDPITSATAQSYNQSSVSDISCKGVRLQKNGLKPTYPKVWGANAPMIK
jgi:hypothetical protein